MSEFRNELSAAADRMEAKADAFGEAGVTPREKECRELSKLLRRASYEMRTLNEYREKELSRFSAAVSATVNNPK